MTRNQNIPTEERATYLTFEWTGEAERKAVGSPNRRAKQSGTEADYDETWGDGR